MGRSSSPDRRDRRSRRSRSRSRSPRRDRSKRKNRFDEGPPGGSKWDMAPNPDDPVQKAAADRLTLSLNLGKIAMGQQTSKYIMVPNASSSSLIGRGGSVINKLKADSGAKIQFQQKDDMAPGAQERGVTISGSAVQVAEAEKLIMVIVNGGGAPIGGPGAPASVAPSASGGGGSGSGIGTGGLIRLGFGGGGGGGGGAAFAAGGLPQRGMPPMQMGGGGGEGQQVISVPMSAVGSIIGRGGSVVRRLMEESGAQIRLQQKEDLKPGQTDREVTITGAPHQVEQAAGMIMEIVVEASGGGGGGGGGGAPPRIGMGGAARGINNKKTMTVLNSDVGCLIGRGGTIIKGLIADSGCHIEIQQKDQMQSDFSGGLMREVYLYGTDEQITTAERMVLNLLPQQYQGTVDGAYGFPPGGSYGNSGVGPAVQWQPPSTSYNNAPPPGGGGYQQQQVGPTEANYNPYGIKPQSQPPHSAPTSYDPYGTNSSSGSATNYQGGGGNSYSTGNNDYGGMSGGGMSDYGYSSGTGASRDGGYAPPPVIDGRGNSQPYGSQSQGDSSWGSSYPPPAAPPDGRGPSEPYRNNNSWAPLPTANNSYAPPPSNSHQPPPPQQQPPWGGNY